MLTQYIKLCKLLKERGIESGSGKQIVRLDLKLTESNIEEYVIYNETEVRDYIKRRDEVIFPAYSISDILRKDTLVKLFPFTRHDYEVSPEGAFRQCNVCGDRGITDECISFWEVERDQILELWDLENSKPLEECEKVISYLIENIKN